MCRNEEAWDTSDCGVPWKQFVFLQELEHCEVTEETQVMKEKCVPHQAEVMGKEGLCGQEGCDQ